MYTSKEVKEIVNDDVSHVDFRESLSGKNLIIITADHSEYRVPYREIEGKIDKGTVVLDVYNMWGPHKQKLEKEGVKHVLLGERDWKNSIMGV